MSADTYSTDGVGVLLMGTGNDNNSWGSNANSNVFQYVVDALTNTLSNAVTGGTLDLSGSPPPTASSQVRYAGLIFTGVLTSNQILQVPNINKWWLVKNATSGSFTLKFKTSGGSASTAIPQNSGWQMVQCDGANAIVVWPFNTGQIQMPDGSAALPAYSDINETNSGWYRNGTQDWRLSINGSDVLQITGAGASSASIVNVLSPNVLQQAGAQIVPPGAEMPYAGIELPSGGWLWEDATAYSRVTYATLFGAITKTATATTNSSTTLSSVSADLRFKGLVGAYIEGTGIPTGTTIAAIAATTITLSQAATASASGVSIRILPWGQGDGSTTFNVPDRRERALFGRGDMNGSSDPARITSAVAGSDPTGLASTFGAQSVTLSQANLPNVNLSSASLTATSLSSWIGGVNGSAGASTDRFVGSNNAGAFTGHTITTSIGGTVPLGGSGTAVNKLPPGGVCNFIIKT